MNNRLLSLFGLKWNPFAPDVPIEALLVGPKIESFCWRVENLARTNAGDATHWRPGRYPNRPAKRERRAVITTRSAASRVTRASTP